MARKAVKIRPWYSYADLDQRSYRPSYTGVSLWKPALC